MNQVQADMQKQIETRAYMLWIEAGQPEGKDVELWLKAEAEVNGKESKGDLKAKPTKPTATAELAEKSAASSGNGAAAKEAPKKMAAKKSTANKTTTEVAAEPKKKRAGKRK